MGVVFPCVGAAIAETLLKVISGRLPAPAKEEAYAL